MRRIAQSAIASHSAPFRTIASTVLRLRTSTKKLRPAVDDDDFVDVVDLSKSKKKGTDNALQSAPPLGVSRTPAVPEGQEFSRLGVPLAVPRNGESPPRESSRAITLREANQRLEEAQQKRGDNGRETRDLATEPLPFDDEEFAETILEMEVDGALDEAWQDTKKAHMEDVIEIVQVLRDLKVRDIAAIDVSQKTSNFDFIVNGTCEGARHIHLASWAVSEADATKRLTKVPRQKTDNLWEIVPVGRILVNLMQASYRDEVNIERKWAVTKSMDPTQFANAAVSEGRQVKSHGLWTLTLNLQDLEDFEVDYCKDILLAQR